MKRSIGTTVWVMSSLAGCASPPGPGPEKADEHASHHAPGAATKAEDARLDDQMKAMHEMHRKMQAARTPEERAALMKEHMKTMHEGMAMMGRMRGGADSAKGPTGADALGEHERLKRRMDMMEMMMQMMMDREGMTAPAVK